MEKKFSIALCYSSYSGNTRLVCQKIADYLAPISIEFYDMHSRPPINPLSYDLFGFASSVEFFGLPSKTIQWIRSIPEISEKKYAFIFLSYGGNPGTALIQLKDLVQSRNFRVIAGHALHCPESYPLLRVRGFKNANAPGEKKFRRFLMFLYILKDLIQSASEGKEILEARFRLGLMNYFFNIPDPLAARRTMGFKYLDEKACTLCKRCALECPFQAIIMDPYPIFNEEICTGCWKCYNRCPTQATYTRNLHGAGHYPEPSTLFKKKFDRLVKNNE